MTTDFPRDEAKALIEQSGLTAGDIVWRPLGGGRNNRTYRIDTSEGPALLKQYHRGGDWDRLGAESRFLRFCEEMGVGRAPRLLGEDVANGLALHSWLDGDRPRPDDLSAADVAEAAAFLGEAARATRAMARTTETPAPARDAGLRLEDFFHSPRRRLAELEAALTRGPETPSAADALAFLGKQLRPAWERAREAVSAELAGNDLRRLFPSHMLVFSPSDFGFHNAIRRRDGGLAFVDFEYAGLDSLAKAIGDFVCQADCPPPGGAVERLAAEACDGAEQAEALARLVRILLPLFRIKFCCIVLNEFKSTDAERRRFAGHGGRETVERQLRKAETMLAQAL